MKFIGLINHFVDGRHFIDCGPATPESKKALLDYFLGEGKYEYSFGGYVGHYGDKCYVNEYEFTNEVGWLVKADQYPDNGEYPSYLYYPGVGFRGTPEQAFAFRARLKEAHPSASLRLVPEEEDNDELEIEG